MSSENITVRFRKRLLMLRKKEGLDAVTDGRCAGKDNSYISDMEGGKKNVCLPTLEVFAQGFGMSMAKLISKL